ncbi:MAG: T9SS type A sorting domain-containing protein [Flavobacterium sp.]
MSSADYNLAYHGGGNRGYAIDTALTTVLGVEDFSLNASVIYPNPSKGSFKIQGKTALNKVTIYTLTGAMVKTIELEKNEENVDVNVADLKTGIYLIELQNDTDKSWKKVLVN